MIPVSPETLALFGERAQSIQGASNGFILPLIVFAIIGGATIIAQATIKKRHALEVLRDKYEKGYVSQADYQKQLSKLLSS